MAVQGFEGLRFGLWGLGFRVAALGSGLSGLWAMTGFRAEELLLAGQALGARLGEQLAMFVMVWRRRQR